VADPVTAQEPPLVVRLYCYFAITITVLSVLRVFAGSSMSVVVPYTGWAGGFRYSITIFFACLAVHSPKYAQAIRSVRWFLVLFIVLGAGQFLWSFGGEDFDNPYLRVSAWRPVFTVLLPCIWFLLLRSRAVTEYIAANPSTPPDLS
jgi:hypothetical protein